MTPQAGSYDGRPLRVLPRAPSHLMPSPLLIVNAMINLRVFVLQIPPCGAYLRDGATSRVVLNYPSESPWGERPLRYQPARGPLGACKGPSHPVLPSKHPSTAPPPQLSIQLSYYTLPEAGSHSTEELNRSTRKFRMRPAIATMYAFNWWPGPPNSPKTRHKTQHTTQTRGHWVYSQCSFTGAQAGCYGANTGLQTEI